MKMFNCLFLSFILPFVMSGHLKAHDKLYDLFADLHAATLKNDSLVEAKCYRAIGCYYNELSKIDSSFYYLNRGLKIAKALGNKKLVASFGNNLADNFGLTGNHASAMAWYDTCAALLRQINDTSALTVILVNSGIEHKMVGDIPMAIKLQTEAIRLKEERHDSTRLAFFYMNLAKLFEKSDTISFEKYLSKALELGKTPAYTTFYTQAESFQIMGEMEENRGRLSQALAWYDSMLVVSRAEAYTRGTALALNLKACILEKMNRNNEALPLLREALELIPNCDDLYLEMVINKEAGAVYFSAGLINKAEPLLRRAADLAKTNNYPETLYHVLRDLSKIEALHGRFESAYRNLEKYVVLKDSINKAETNKLLFEIQTKYETEKKDAQILLLQAQQQANQRFYWLLVAVIVLVAMSLLSLYVVSRFRQRAEKTARLLAENATLLSNLEKDKIREAFEAKSRELTTNAMHVVQKNTMLSKVKDQIEALQTEDRVAVNALLHQLEMNLKSEEDWNRFKVHYESVHPGFFKKLKNDFPALTPNDERLSAYLKLNMTTKEIAQLLSLTTMAVDKSRNRLRKKLNMQPGETFVDFLKNY